MEERGNTLFGKALMLIRNFPLSSSPSCGSSEGKGGRYEVLSRNVTVDYIALTKKKIRNALI